MKAKTIGEAVEKVKGLVERVKYKSGELLPSQIESELQGALQSALAEFGDSPPKGWNDLVATVRMFLTEAAKTRQSGATDHYYRNIQEGCDQLMAAEQEQAENENLLSLDQAIKRTDFNLLSPAAKMAHFKAGKTLVD